SASGSRCSSPDRSEGWLAGSTEGGRLVAADLAQGPAAAWTLLAAPQVDPEELAMLDLDVRRHEMAQALGGIGQHGAHGGGETIHLFGPQRASTAERSQLRLP